MEEKIYLFRMLNSMGFETACIQRLLDTGGGGLASIKEKWYAILSTDAPTYPVKKYNQVIGGFILARIGFSKMLKPRTEVVHFQESYTQKLEQLRIDLRTVLQSSNNTTDTVKDVLHRCGVRKKQTSRKPLNDLMSILEDLPVPDYQSLFKTMTSVVLRNQLGALGLSKTGPKQVQVDRLMEVMNDPQYKHRFPLQLIYDEWEHTMGGGIAFFSGRRDPNWKAQLRTAIQYHSPDYIQGYWQRNNVLAPLEERCPPLFLNRSMREKLQEAKWQMGHHRCSGKTLLTFNFDNPVLTDTHKAELNLPSESELLVAHRVRLETRAAQTIDVFRTQLGRDAAKITYLPHIHLKPATLTPSIDITNTHPRPSAIYP